MNEHQVLRAKIKYLNNEELRRFYAFCEMRIKRAAENGPELQRWEARRVQIAQEIDSRANT